MLHIVYRTILLYLTVLILIRLMGKREIGQLSTFDFVVSVIVAELAAIPMEQMNKPLLPSIIPIITVVGAEILLSYLGLKSNWLRGLIDGKPSVIMEDGKLQIAEMRRCRYNLEDLLTQLREQGIADPSLVNHAILETTGKLSIFLKEQPHLYTPLVMDGAVHMENLNKLGKDTAWLFSQMAKLGYTEIQQVFFASIDDGGNLQVFQRHDQVATN